MRIEKISEYEYHAVAHCISCGELRTTVEFLHKEHCTNPILKKRGMKKNE